MKLVRPAIALFTALPVALLSAGLAQSSASAQLTRHVAPAIEKLGRNMGQESPSTPLNLTVWLKLHNQADLDAKVKAMYTTGGPGFHKWMTTEDLKTYAPTAAEMAAVKQELAAHHLAVTSSDALNFSVHVTGQTSDVESAFHTQVGRYMVKNELVRTSSTVPELAGAAAGLVAHVGGLNSLTMKPMLTYPIDPRTHQRLGVKPASGAKPNGAYYSSQCFYNPATVTLSGVDAFDGVTPETMTYTGLTFGSDPANTALGTLSPCGYSPANVSSIYGLNKAYAEGLNGKGQTIVLLDPYLEPTIQSDIDLFDNIESLPAVTIDKVNPLGATLSGIDQGWNEEADLDVEWSHAVAPGAKIVLLEAFSSDNEDLQSALLYAVTNHLGNVISNSYGSPESYTSPLANNIWNQIIELAASQGISVHFSTGDSGDFTIDGIPADVSSPADSPYATAVGGTTVALLPGGDGATSVTTGWGTNTATLSFSAGSTNYIYLPTETQGFYAGSGGGVSSFFAKPDYQAALPGPGRHLPDVSALADPFTGGEFVFTSGPNQYVGVVGGTSLASPIFSGMWAILDQAVSGSLGQAAPLIAYGANSPFIQDVLPLSGIANVSGSVKTPTATDTYSATALAEPLVNTTQFSSALWNLGSNQYELVTFGTDSGLTVTQGWDNVTGYGTPNIGNIADLIGSIK